MSNGVKSDAYLEVIERLKKEMGEATTAPVHSLIIIGFTKDGISIGHEIDFDKIEAITLLQAAEQAPKNVMKCLAALMQWKSKTPRERENLAKDAERERRAELKRGGGK